MSVWVCARCSADRPTASNSYMLSQRPAFLRFPPVFSQAVEELSRQPVSSLSSALCNDRRGKSGHKFKQLTSFTTCEQHAQQTGHLIFCFISKCTELLIDIRLSIIQTLGHIVLHNPFFYCFNHTDIESYSLKFNLLQMLLSNPDETWRHMGQSAFIGLKDHLNVLHLSSIFVVLASDSIRNESITIQYLLSYLQRSGNVATSLNGVQVLNKQKISRLIWKKKLMRAYK